MKKRRLLKELDVSSLDQRGQELYNQYKAEYENMNIQELRERGRRMLLPASTGIAKDVLVRHLAQARMSNSVIYKHDGSNFRPLTQADKDGLMDNCLRPDYVANPEFVEGKLFIRGNEARLRENGFSATLNDVYVPTYLINKHGLLSGDTLYGKTRFIGNAGQSGMFEVLRINETDAEEFRRDYTVVAPRNFYRPKYEGAGFADAINMLSLPQTGHKRVLFSEEFPYTAELTREMTEWYSKQGFYTITVLPDGNAPLANADESVALHPGRDDYGEETQFVADYTYSLASKRNCALIVNNAELVPADVLLNIAAKAETFKNGSFNVLFISGTLGSDHTTMRLIRYADEAIRLKWMYGEGMLPLVDIRFGKKVNNRILNAIADRYADYRRIIAAYFEKE